MIRDSVVLYRSIAEAIKEYPKSKQLAALWAVIDYGLDGKEYEGEGLAKSAFLIAKPLIDVNNKRYENSKKGGAPKGNQNARKQPKDNQKTTKKQPNVNVNVNDNANDNKRRFVKPTVEQVREYCLERGNGIDPQSFIDYYETRGWKLGKGVSMKDWKAAVRTWESRRYKKTTKPPERDYDMDKLELRLLATN